MFPTQFRYRIVTVLTAAALTIGAGTVAFGQVHAATNGPARLELAATALKPAVRLSQSGVIMFPMNPLPRCALSKTSFGQSRPDGRTHEGIDLMAALGQEIYAVGNGVLWRQVINGEANSALSGNAWYVRLPDGTFYFYGHMSAFAADLKLGDPVTRGQLIGYVGDTGNPGPGNYHLHFEVHPKGGAAVDPYPLLTIPKSCQVVD
jgi:murein DD-endopeptidase MepM/ murein hydrolase activator NlpD